MEIELGMTDFVRKMQEFAQSDQIMKVGKLVRAMAFGVTSNLIDMTPVGNPDLWKNPRMAAPGYAGGHARASWHISIGEPYGGDDEERPDDIDGSRASTEIQTVMNQYMISASKAQSIAGMPVVWIVNNVPYIEALENGHSTQAPSGFFNVAIARIDFDIEFMGSPP